MHPVFNNIDVVSQILSYTFDHIKSDVPLVLFGFDHWTAHMKLWKIGHISHMFRAAVTQQLQDKLIIRISNSPSGAVFRGEHVYGATSVPVDSLVTSLVRKVILQFHNSADSEEFVVQLLDLFETRDWRSLRNVWLCQCYKNRERLPEAVFGGRLGATTITKRVIALVPSVDGVHVEYKDWWLGRDGRIPTILDQRAATLNELSLKQPQSFNLSQLSLPSLTVLNLCTAVAATDDNVLPQLCVKTLRKLVLDSVTRRQFIAAFRSKTGAVSVFSELEHLSLKFCFDRNDSTDMDCAEHVGMFGFPKLRNLYISHDKVKLRYFFKNFVGSPLSRLHVRGCCDFLRHMRLLVFTHIESFCMYLAYTRHEEAKEIHRRVVTAGMPLRLVTLASSSYYELPYVVPTRCPIVQKYETTTAMSAIQLCEVLGQMPLVLRVTFQCYSTNAWPVTIDDVVDTLADTDLSPLDSKLQVLQALGCQNTDGISRNKVPMELAEIIPVIARLPMLQMLTINVDPEECKHLLRQVMEELQSMGFGHGLDYFGSLQVNRAPEYWRGMFE